MKEDQIMFVGDIITESQIDPTVLDEFSGFVISRRTANVANFTPSLWHIARYRLPHEAVQRLTPKLKDNIQDNAWYVHFYSETTDELYVILSGKVFKLPKHRDSTWDEMITYGESVGVGRRWTERIPVDFEL